MPRFYGERVAFATSTTGTGNIAVGSRLGTSFRIPSETSIANGDTVMVLVQEGNDYMIADATYNSAGPTLTINSVKSSIISGVAGTTQMSLLGAATVRFLGAMAFNLDSEIVRADKSQSLSSAYQDTACANAGAERLGKTGPSNVQTNDYTLALADGTSGKPVRMNKSTAVNLTIPPNASVAFPTETYINVEQYGAGQVTLVPGAGVTIRSFNGQLKLAGQYAGATLRKIATDEWIAFGNLTS